MCHTIAAPKEGSVVNLLATTCLSLCAVQYNNISPAMDGLLLKLEFINNTIMELPQAMQDAYSNLAAAKTQMVGCYSRDIAAPGKSWTTCHAELCVSRRALPVEHHISGTATTDDGYEFCLQDTAMTGNPSPTTLATNLTNFSNSFPDLAALDALSTNLQTAEDDLFVMFPAANTAQYLSWVNAAR